MTMRGGGWGGHMGRMGADEEPGGSLYDHQVVRRLFRYLRPHWRLLTLSGVAMLVYTGTVVVLPRIVGWTVDRQIGPSIDTGDLGSLDLIVLAYVAVAVVQFGANYLHLRLMAYVGQAVLFRMRMDLFSHLQRLSMSYFDRNEVGRVMSRVQNDIHQLQEFISIVMLTIADVLSLAGIIAMMASMNAGLAAITLSVVPVLVVVLLVWQRFARAAYLRTRLTIATVNAGLQENISGVRVVQSLNRERVNTQRFGEANRDNLYANLQATRLSSALIPAVEVLTAIGLGLVVFFGGTMVLEGSLGAGGLLAFALYIQRFFEPVRNLTMQYSSLQRAMVAGSRVFEFLDTEPEIKDKPGAVSPELTGQLSFEGVGLRYTPEEPVLQDIDLHIGRGETVAFVGPTGAGKTSLVSAVLRLYDVTEGRISVVDGVDIKDIEREALVSQMGIVPQEPYLFSATVEENIRFNHPKVTREDVERAARVVGAHEFISELEQGYDTPVQERGANLSIGQRQLICMARALVAEPRVLILDEATANIDTYSEVLIQRALKELLLDRTVLVIAHRLSTVRGADRIVVLDKGRVVEQGGHDELMAAQGLYARLQSFTANGGGEAVDASADGTWTLTFTTPRGTRSGTLVLKTLGPSLSGKWQGERGDQELSGGTVDGDRLAWEIEMAGPRGTIVRRFEGTLEGDTISGRVDLGPFGSTSFTATRASR